MNKSNSLKPDAQAMIKQTGARSTAARGTLLNTLLAADHALTHNEVEQVLADSNSEIERVTLYRVLEWLVDHELAHKILGADRVWRFNAQRHPVPRHAHFNCTRCGRVFCLENLSPVLAITLPPGYLMQKAEISLQGLCPACSH